MTPPNSNQPGLKALLEANDELRKENVELKRSIVMFIAELEGAYIGLMAHPSDAPLNGCQISVASKEKLIVLKEILKHYGKL